MRRMLACLVACGGVVAATTATAQTKTAPSVDVYHVHFTKAAPGQAAALGKALMVPDKTTAMPEHFIVLRHQEGDDWDYLVIQHLGPKAEVSAAAPATPAAVRDLRAWHNDTFVSGPSWAEFTKQMGAGGTAGPSGAVYVVGVHRPVPGHREQLETALNTVDPASKVQTGNVILQHLEGSDWTFLTISRYNSWQDFATERAAAASAAASTPGGWANIREHSAFHRDTIVDRIYPAKYSARSSVRGREGARPRPVAPDGPAVFQPGELFAASGRIECILSRTALHQSLRLRSISPPPRGRRRR